MKKSTFKITKKDILSNTIFFITFLIIYLILTKNEYLFASTIDFKHQHYLIPEYLRTLFYDTHDLFPDFALNIGSGQNIYYLSYYGLFNPYILFSYLFPNVKMIDYLITTNCLIILISTNLLYFYLRKNKYNEKTSFITTFLFLMSGPLIFHAKRHIMFINYFPFLILGLFGIDAFFEKKKTTLLTLSIILIILSSFYFSIPCLIVLFFFSLYKYIKKNIIITRKKTISFLKKILPSFLIGILSTTILTLPTFYVLLNGRSSSDINPTLKELLTPSLISSLLYSPYTIGLTFISIITLIYFALRGKRETKYLAITCLLITIFPIFNFILNGTLYINAKSLIPFNLLILLLIAKFLTSHLNKKLTIKQFFILSYLFTTSFLICLYTNKTDTLMKKSELNNSNYKTTINLIKEITTIDQSFYRINNQVQKQSSMNKVTNINEYKTSIYSSTSNQNYMTTFNHILDNPIPNRNKFMIAPSTNLISQILLSEKYILTKDKLDSNLQLLKEQNGIKLYKNNNTLPLGYATNQIINNYQYNQLPYPTNNIALLNYVILNDNTNQQKKLQNISIKKIDYTIIRKNNVKILENNYTKIIKANKNASITIQLNEKTTNRILFLRFSNAYTPTQDLSITINNTENKLTDRSWKYFNNNIIFNYVLSGTNTLNIYFKKGTYQLTNFESYILNYDTIKNIKNNIDTFKMDSNQTKGDTIKGTINITRDNSYFTISIPYDKGFTIKVDKKNTPYQKTGTNFIAFPIKKGQHTIEITYEAPYKKLSIFTSLIGIILFIINYLKEKKKLYT